MADEAERLAALHELGLLDSAPEERFDRIVRLARRIFGVPIALVTLVDSQRLWFKAWSGLESSQAPREGSFCSQTILEPEGLVVEDASQDQRFAGYPSVSGPPHLRFYAGQPLLGPRGHALGTLCIQDVAPRRMSAEELASLRDLALLASEQIRDQKLSEALTRLGESENRMRAMMNSMAEGIITFRPSGKVESFNRAAERRFGYLANQVIGEHFSYLLAAPEPAEVLAGIERHFPLDGREVEALRYEVVGRRRDGLTFPAELSMSLITLNSRRRFIGVFRDISERKQMEAMREDLTQMIVHDLKTPLTAILGLSRLVLKEAGPKLGGDLCDDLEQIRSAASQMLEMVSSLLDVSRLEAGKMPLQLRSCDLTRVVQEAVSSLVALAADRVELRLPSGPVPWSCDTDLIGRVLANLVGNALKHNPAGAPVRVELEPRTGRVRLSVADSGRGIPASMHARIFEKFGQIGPGRPHSSGLGLTFCKLAVEAHGGQIGLESHVGQGSTFWFELPQSEDGQPPQARPLRILLGEDSQFHQRLAVRLLAGHEVVPAGNGREVLERWREGPFDLVLMDLEMPDGNGLEAAAAIRGQEAPGTRVPIVAMTAHPADEVRDQCTAAGMDGVLSKPLAVAELAEVLASLTLTAGPAPRLKLDRGRILLRLGGDETILAEMAETFLATCPRHLQAIARALDRGDHEVVQREAHSLKGAIGYFEEGEALRTALRLERCGRDQQLEEARTVLRELEAAMPPLEEAVRGLLPAAAQ